MSCVLSSNGAMFPHLPAGGNGDGKNSNRCDQHGKNEFLSNCKKAGDANMLWIRPKVKLHTNWFLWWTCFNISTVSIFVFVLLNNSQKNTPSLFSSLAHHNMHTLHVRQWWRKQTTRAVKKSWRKTRKLHLVATPLHTRASLSLYNVTWQLKAEAGRLFSAIHG